MSAKHPLLTPPGALVTMVTPQLLTGVSNSANHIVQIKYSVNPFNTSLVNSVYHLTPQKSHIKSMCWGSNTGAGEEVRDLTGGT